MEQSLIRAISGCRLRSLAWNYLLEKFWSDRDVAEKRRAISGYEQ